MTPTLIRAILPLLLAVAAATGLRAQGDLVINDVLPPYHLSASLLANGHFSITTRYTGSPKMLVYQEDGSANKPVNYTSHIHFKVDDVLFALPFELNPGTREAPPEHPLQITRLYRDTVAGAPRINAAMYGVMPGDDTLRFLFTMQPVERPSGGFIRMSAEVINSTSARHAVGVLLLVDTKIGDNDQAPIISSFGYRTVETEFMRGQAPGMPEYWLGLEGAPTRPGLTARGNLRAPGLLPPDYFLFGNWKDNTTVAGAFGMDRAQWRERRAFDVGYTDSAILLLWDQSDMAPGERRLCASTEIGIVDSLQVGVGGAGGRIALAGAGRGGACIGFGTVVQLDCADTSYQPYAPDSLQSLFLATNTGAQPLNNLRLVAPALPAGLGGGRLETPMIPAMLGSNETGVAALALRALPRLHARAYSVPVALVGNGGDTLMHDTICVSVPGLLGQLKGSPVRFAPLCPGGADTMAARVRLNGPRCDSLLPRAVLLGAPADVARFSLVGPLPTLIPANNQAEFRVRYSAGNTGETHTVRLAVFAVEHGLNDSDRDTTVVISDTITITGTARDAEFVFANTTDTLDLGAVCVGNSTAREWTISNIGGCELSIERDYLFENDPLGQFSMANDSAFPLRIQRGTDRRATIRFAPSVAGPAVARLIIHSGAAPYADTLVVRGRGDVPAYMAHAPGTTDTVCPGRLISLQIPIDNPTACDVAVTGVACDNNAFAVDTGGFVIPPSSSRRIVLSGRFAVPGTYNARVTVRAAQAGDTTLAVRVVVASRQLDAPSLVDFGEARPGRPGAAKRISITSTGSAGTTVSDIRVAGANAAEFSYSLPNGERLPAYVPAGSTLEVDVVFAPTGLDTRRALLVVASPPNALCEPLAPVELSGRGVMPIIDAPQRSLQAGRICAGQPLDTVIVLRNPGNAPLQVDGLVVEQRTGRAMIAAAGLPTTIAPDSARAIRITMDPQSLGPIETALHFTSDGVWFTAPDTAVRITTTGIICGTLWADTVHAVVGQHASVGIHLDASPLAPADVARLMNESDARELTIEISGDGRLMRFGDTLANPGMLANMSPTVLAAGGAARISAANAGGEITGSSLVAVLDADVLLGTGNRTPLHLAIGSFANGNARLITRPGLLVAEYCALPRRYVQSTGPYLAPASVPLPANGTLLMHLEHDARATITLSNSNGALVATLFNAQAARGTYHVPINGVVPASGMYVATLVANGIAVSVPIVILR